MFEYWFWKILAYFRVFQVATAAVFKVAIAQKNQAPARFLFNKASTCIQQKRCHVHYFQAENKGMNSNAAFHSQTQLLQPLTLAGMCQATKRHPAQAPHKQYPPPQRTTSTHNQHNLTFNSFLSN